jgi:hypothetical protein
MRKYRRKWYYKNKERSVLNVKNRIKRLKVWLRDLKKTLKCSRCGEDHPACLQFHHKDPKSKEVSLSQVYKLGWGQERILAEIAKCEVLCANCHFKHHDKLRVGGGHAGRSPKPAANGVRVPYTLSKKIVLRP